VVGAALETIVALQRRQAIWQVFRPTTRCCLEQVEAVGGETLAEALAEAIRRERDRPGVSADRVAEQSTGAA
jgi:hypothetical protein